MINCKNCGVELDEHMNYCPLCGAPVFDKDPEKREKLVRQKQAVSTRLKTEIDSLNKVQKKKFFWEVISIIVASGVLSALTLNFIIQTSLSWSLYVLAGGLTIFAYVTVLSFVKNGWLVMFSLFVVSSSALLFIDLVDTTLGWSVKLGIPLLIAVVLLLAVVILAIKQTPEKGFNIIAYIFLASAILSIAVDGLVSLYIENQVNLNWSVIVFGSTLPMAFVLLYMHYKLRRGTDLRKFFHI
jgi:hypothetical protein